MKKTITPEESTKTITIANKIYFFDGEIGKGNSGSVYNLKTQSGEETDLVAKDFKHDENTQEQARAQAQQAYQKHRLSAEGHVSLHDNVLVIKKHTPCRFGANLFEVIENEETEFEAITLIALAAVMLEAIDNFHKNFKRVHCDLALNNFIFTANADIKLVDFDSSQTFGEKAIINTRKQYFLPQITQANVTGIKVYFDYWIAAISMMQIFLKKDYRSVILGNRVAEGKKKEEILHDPLRPIDDYHLRDCLSLEAKQTLVQWFNTHYCNERAITNPKDLPNIDAMLAFIVTLPRQNAQTTASLVSNIGKQHALYRATPPFKHLNEDEYVSFSPTFSQ